MVFRFYVQPLRESDSWRLKITNDLMTGYAETIVIHLRQRFEPSTNLTVDEQLVEFHGRVRFRQYIDSKPGKFGIKTF